MCTNPTNRLVVWLRGVGLVLAGVVVLGLAVLEFLSIRDFVDHAHHADGVVIALTAGPAHSEVQFVDPTTGGTETFPGNGFGASHRVGDRVKVLWLRREGGVLHAQLDEWGPLWGFNVHTGGTGLALVIGGLVVLRRGLRKQA
jgi:hypothetical protein